VVTSFNHLKTQRLMLLMLHPSLICGTTQDAPSFVRRIQTIQDALLTKSEAHAQLMAGIYNGQIAYTPEQAALAVGRSRSRIFKAIKDGELTARKDGKATILEDGELRRWVRTLPTIGRETVTA
jgi:hypothetical protein